MFGVIDIGTTYHGRGKLFEAVRLHGGWNWSCPNSLLHDLDAAYDNNNSNNNNMVHTVATRAHVQAGLIKRNVIRCTCLAHGKNVRSL